MLPAEAGERMRSKPKDGRHLKQLEAHWQVRVRQAQRRYLEAVERHSAMADELARRSPVEPDGSFAVAKARRAEAWARHELARATHIYSDLVVRRIQPPQDDDDADLMWWSY